MTNVRQRLDQIVRRQRSKLTAQLVKHCGYQKLPLIEDAIQDALVKALEKWEFEGIPDRADAWLHRVALNRAIDLLRKLAPEVEFPEDFRPAIEAGPVDTAELNLLLYCCHPALKTIEQQLLMLHLVLGLDHQELASLTLASKASISQRLSRAKRKLRADPGYQLTLDSLAWNEEIFTAVTTAIYTAFSVGYFPRQGALPIRRDVALAALNLGQALADHAPAHAAYQGRLYALAALMCFQCSRLDARANQEGKILLLEQQNPERWDPELIQRGHKLLLASKQGGIVSDFHIEAAIAALHLKPDETDWQVVSSLHRQLLELDPTPGRLIAAAVAFGRSGNPQDALALLDTLSPDQMSRYAPYHLARADALKLLGQTHAATVELNLARQASTSLPITAMIEQQLI